MHCAYKTAYRFSLLVLSMLYKQHSMCRWQYMSIKTELLLIMLLTKVVHVIIVPDCDFDLQCVQTCVVNPIYTFKMWRRCACKWKYTMCVNVYACMCFKNTRLDEIMYFNKHYYPFKCVVLLVDFAYWRFPLFSFWQYKYSHVHRIIATATVNFSTKSVDVKMWIWS